MRSDQASADIIGCVEATAVSHKQDTQSQPASGLQLAIAAHEIPHPAKVLAHEPACCFVAFV